jgi:hypothetical protein
LGVDLTAIPGISVLHVQTILAELGGDVSQLTACKWALNGAQMKLVKLDKTIDMALEYSTFCARSEPPKRWASSNVDCGKQIAVSLPDDSAWGTDWFVATIVVGDMVSIGLGSPKKPLESSPSWAYTDLSSWKAILMGLAVPAIMSVSYQVINALERTGSLFPSSIFERY